jgi:hypothetical protein
MNKQKVKGLTKGLLRLWRGWADKSRSKENANVIFINIFPESSLPTFSNFEFKKGERYIGVKFFTVVFLAAKLLLEQSLQ